MSYILKTCTGIQFQEVFFFFKDAKFVMHKNVHTNEMQMGKN